MSTKNNLGTLKESTEAIASVDTHSSTASARQAMVPPANQLIGDEVETFFHTNEQSALSSEDVEFHLLNRINNRLIAENVHYGLKGRRAYDPLKALPPFVISTCILKRELPHTCLIGESEETAALMTYQTAGPDEGLYVPAEKRIRKLARWYNRMISAKDLSAVVECVRDSVQMRAENQNGDIVALANGLFDLRAKKLLPFSPDVVLRTKASVAFREDATTCPDINGWNVDDWIRETVANNDPQVEQLVWQVFLALFQPYHSFNKAVFLYSPTGSNGKGTLLELMRNLIGPKRVATLSMSGFDKTYLPKSLLNCFAVFSDENKVGDFMRDSSTFKAWVSHDPIDINVKYGEMTTVRGRGLYIGCVNELPSSKDKSESFYRRFIVVPFLNRYVGADENPAIKDDYIKRPEVLEYIVHKVLMMPLFDKVIEPDVCKKLLDQMRVENDPVLQFAEEFLPQFKWDFLPWDFVYGVYSAWMDKEVPSGRPVSSREFNKRLSAYVDEHPSCGWFVPRGADGKQTPVRTGKYIIGEEPLAVKYDITNWFDIQPVNGSIRKVGTPHNIPILARGLQRMQRIGTSSTDDE